MKKQIKVLKLTGYKVKGVSDLSMWGGGNASIEMKPFDVDKPTRANLLNNINDNGFGVQSINGAICDVYKNFEGTLEFLCQFVFGKVSENPLINYNQA